MAELGHPPMFDNHYFLSVTTMEEIECGNCHKPGFRKYRTSFGSYCVLCIDKAVVRITCGLCKKISEVWYFLPKHQAYVCKRCIRPSPSN